VVSFLPSYPACTIARTCCVGFFALNLVNACLFLQLAKLQQASAKNSGGG